MPKPKAWKHNIADKPSIRLNPKVSNLLLPVRRVKTTGRVIRVEHAGTTHETPLKTDSGKVLAVIKDPTRKDRVIVLRHKDTPKSQSNAIKEYRYGPYGKYSLNSLWRGKERQVGKVVLKDKANVGSFVCDLAVLRHTRKKESSHSPEALKHKEQIHMYNELESPIQLALPPSERFEALDAIKRYDYRKKGLCTFMMSAVEENARQSQLRQLVADFDPNTTEKFMNRYGWKQIGEHRYIRLLT